jgi:glyoxylase-like metal-dependent hydrolase (beta-lactamase superfamily II)
MKIHVVSTGQLVWKKHALRGSTPLAMPLAVFDRRKVAFPVNCFVLEHDEGLIAIDTGAQQAAAGIRGVYRPAVDALDELGPQLRARGLDPADITTVVLTHLDVDHAGGLRHLPNATVWLHRPEYEFAKTRIGAWRFQPNLWPDGFDPKLYELAPRPYLSFDTSLPITARGDVRIVPLPGHSVGHVGVAVEDGDRRLIVTGDHTLNAAWFAEDLAAGRLVMQAQFGRHQARDTTRRLAAALHDAPTVLLPSHDANASTRLATREPIILGPVMTNNKSH